MKVHGADQGNRPYWGTPDVISIVAIRTATSLSSSRIVPGMMLDGAAILNIYGSLEF